MFVGKLAPAVLEETSVWPVNTHLKGDIKVSGGKEMFGDKTSALQHPVCSFLHRRWLLMAPLGAAPLSPVQRLRTVRLPHPVPPIQLACPVPVPHPDVRPRASSAGLTSQPVASHPATSLAVVTVRAWWGAVHGARKGRSTAMRRRRCSS